jgi:ABC-type siderophore export system fused ATPase/permease subunit
LGRIAVLKEARGKRRLIGITDWWTQLIFRPLHDSVYNFLNTLDEDGTRDQSLVVEKFLNKLKVNALSGVKNRQLQSMDLSAATDRLPVKLQAQILNILGYDGNT